MRGPSGGLPWALRIPASCTTGPSPGRPLPRAQNGHPQQVVPQQVGGPSLSLARCVSAGTQAGLCGALCSLWEHPQGQGPKRLPLQSAPAPSHACGHNCNFPPQEAGRLHPGGRGWWVRGEGFPSRAKGLQGAGRHLLFRHPGRMVVAPGPLLCGTSQACQSRDAQLGRTGRGRWQPQLDLFSAVPPPVNLCHPRDASDQIWGFLHAVIGSQEVLTGLGRRLPRDTGGKWLSHDLGAWARDESWFPILTSVLLASLPGPGRAKGHSEGAWSRLWLLSPLLLIN